MGTRKGCILASDCRDILTSISLGAYGFLDDLLYFELSGYRPLSTNTQLVLGTDTTGFSPIVGIAPYWRVAVEPNFGNHSLEFGTFGLKSSVVPMGMSSAGNDSFTDIGVDAQYQYLGDPHAVTFRAAWIHENHATGASQALGLADNSHNTLRSLNASRKPEQRRLDHGNSVPSIQLWWTVLLAVAERAHRCAIHILQ